MDPHFFNVDQTTKEPSDVAADLFTRHSDSVLCCSIDKNNRLAVSGGIDDTAFVWDLSTKHVIFECSGHKESVVAADFSANSTYVATGDLNGYIQVRNTTTGIKVFDYEIDEINWILWHNSSEFVLLAGTTKGDFWMWNVNDPAALKTFPSYGSPTTAAKLLSDGMKIVVSYQDGSIRIFDLKTRQAIFQFADLNHSEIICMDLNPNKALLAVGCIDSSVKLITVGNCRMIGTLSCKSPDKQDDSTDSTSVKTCETMEHSGSSTKESCSVDKDAANNGACDTGNPAGAEPLEVIDEYSATADTDLANDEDYHAEDDEDFDSDYNDGDEAPDNQSVESVLFSPCGNFLAAANNSGTIFIWDVASQVARCELHTGVGITRCAWSREGLYITGCLDGFVRVYDMNLNRLKEIAAHKDQVLDVAYRDKTLVTASEDKTCRVTRL